MFSTLLSATVVFAVAIHGVVADFAINTPSLKQCETAHISWAPAVAPYNLAVVNSNDPCGDIALDLGDHNGTTMSWLVTLPVGSQVLLSLLDNDDAEAWSGNMTVEAGNSTSCLTNSTNDASTSTDTSVSTTGAATGAPVGTTLVIANVPSATTGVNGVATPVGAANAGELGSSSGAVANVFASRSTVVGGSLVAILAVMVF